MIYTKTISFQVFAGDIKIALKGSDAPTDRPLCQQSTGVFVSDAHMFHNLARNSATLLKPIK